MRIYEWKCRVHHNVMENFSNTDAPVCEQCMSNGNVGRYYGSVQLAASSFDPHFNYTVGRYVTSQRDFEQKLREAGDRASERTGLLHSYVPADPSDKKALGVTDEGIHEQERHFHDSGQKTLTTRTFS